MVFSLLASLLIVHDLICCLMYYLYNCLYQIPGKRQFPATSDALELASVPGSTKNKGNMVKVIRGPGMGASHSSLIIHPGRNC
ncbi:hypothetical protein BDP81DRAFT_417359 [Colletotrichum phormii]|uniref:Uncharacterized protein n=1 Tax=Colletotrichum phormii TaxID=359342 RepID=A0AAJ0A353_9PEZI|nr:uncharacterized protein BDP81DRAFT_417359 [Colletotrichum phormii]KAK1655103.1 hypothetical protein BDP81DRAFT_417359 [Colletotrichum phormii]